MRYVGGKVLIAKQIVRAMRAHLPYANYYEPFVGGAAIAVQVAKVNPRAKLHLSDAHPDLILMYQAIQNGWEPPEYASEETYDALKNQPPSALRGFVGFGGSFGGKFFGGYARGEGRNFVGECKRSTVTAISAMPNATFRNCEYSAISIEPGSLVYCDPPYQGTTGYSVGAFDSAAFWEWARKISYNCQVYVSEYTAPSDFECILEIKRKETLKIGTGSERVERLFTLKQ